LVEERIMIARRKFLHLTAGAAIAPALPRIASALDYPTRPVRVVVGFAAGGTPDITARLIAEALTARIGQTFFVEDKPGAGTNLGTEAVATSAPDGYTLLHVTTVNVLSALIHDKLNFDFARDIVPVVNLVHGAFVMVVNPEFPAKSVAEFIANAKANPGKINMASTGSGNLTHVAGELFKMMAGVDLVHVPYGTEGAAQTDLMSGRAHVMFDPVLSSVAQIKAGKLKALGVTTLKRAEILPDTPPIGDTVTGYEVTGWQGMGAPRNTPADIIDKLNATVNAAFGDPKLRGRLADLGQDIDGGTPADFGKLIAEETEKWGRVVRAANIKAG
jgi:tripartite-type tricarboxylate transporter receptor subunit TctC